jgi:hypothetical protein
MECEGEFSTIRIVKPKFPNAVTSLMHHYKQEEEGCLEFRFVY